MLSKLLDEVITRCEELININEKLLLISLLFSHEKKYLQYAHSHVRD